MDQETRIVALEAQVKELVAAQENNEKTFESIAEVFGKMHQVLNEHKEILNFVRNWIRTATEKIMHFNE